MPPLQVLNLFGTAFYKDIAPTALEDSHPKTTSETVIQKIFDELPVP